MEPTAEDTLYILHGILEQLEEHNRLYYIDAGFVAAASLSTLDVFSGSGRTRRSALLTGRARQCTRSELVNENDALVRKTQLGGAAARGRELWSG